MILLFSYLNNNKNSAHITFIILGILHDIIFMAE